MAEFCLDCFNELMKMNYKRYQVKFFSGVDLCENCGQYKKCVARVNIFGEIEEERQYRKKDKINKTKSDKI